jgi:hypothetical protein
MVSGRLTMPGRIDSTVQSLLTEALDDGGGGWQGETTPGVLDGASVGNERLFAALRPLTQGPPSRGGAGCWKAAQYPGAVARLNVSMKFAGSSAGGPSTNSPTGHRRASGALRPVAAAVGGAMPPGPLSRPSRADALSWASWRGRPSYGLPMLIPVTLHGA